MGGVCLLTRQLSPVLKGYYSLICSGIMINISMKKPTTLEQRFKLASLAAEQFGHTTIPILVDPMDNNVNKAFGNLNLVPG